MQANSNQTLKNGAKRALNNSNSKSEIEENPKKIHATFSKVIVKPLMKNDGLTAKQQATIKKMNEKLFTDPNKEIKIIKLKIDET